MPTVVYDHTSLINWQSEYATLDPLIEQNNLILKSYRKQLELINARSSSMQYQLDQMDTNTTDIEPTLKKATKESLEDELERVQIQRAMLRSEMEPYEAEASIQKADTRKKWLEEHIPAAEFFLHTLYAAPATLVHDLRSQLIKAFTEYEDNHLLGLSPQVRISMIAVRYGLPLLLVQDDGVAPEYMNRVHQNNYLRLVGFLWTMYYRVNNENKDPQFIQLLGNLIEKTHIVHNGSLPDFMKTEHTAQGLIEESKRLMPAYFAIPEHQLPQIEQNILNTNLLYFTQNKFMQLTDLQRLVIKAMDQIDIEVKIKRQKQEAIDYHFYGRTVRILGEIFQNPNRENAEILLFNIAEHASGSCSISKQAIGSVLIILGTLLMFTSIAGLIFSLGSSSLLSTCAFSLGLTLFEAQLGCVLASSAAAATGFYFTFFRGPNLIKAGLRQGLSQELMEIKEIVEDLPPPYGYAIG